MQRLALAEAERFRDYMKTAPFGARLFARRPVSEAVIAACIAAAGTAPSGANHQPWHFVAIGDPAMKARIREGAEEEERAFYSAAARATNGLRRWNRSEPACRSRT